DFSDGMGIIGSPAYMAPELLEVGKATKQTDVFSLGVTLYELLTGEQPFKGETILEIIRKVINEEPVPVHQLNSAVPENVSQVVMRALEKMPVNRYRGTMELIFHFKSAVKEAKFRLDAEKVDERVKYMKALNFFNEFREDELTEVLRIGTWFHYKKGAKIVKEDESDNNFFIVILGYVEVERQGKIIARIERGNCFGEMAAFSGQKRTATILAADDCVVIKIDAGIIDNLAKDLQIKFFKQFLQSLIFRLDSTSGKIVH
ncbi:MAG: cyclic nucleotide-binding domain-containing protein, partial [Pseudomonadota bacterium]